MTPLRMHAHIMSLALKHTVSIEKSEGSGSFAQPQQRRIILDNFPIGGSRAYAVALHEMGHVVEPLAHPEMSEAEHRAGAEGRTTPFRMGGEIAAWYWARSVALVWDRTMEYSAQYSLHSYAHSVRWASHPNVIVRLSGMIDLEK